MDVPIPPLPPITLPEGIETAVIQAAWKLYHERRAKDPATDLTAVVLEALGGPKSTTPDKRRSLWRFIRAALAQP